MASLAVAGAAKSFLFSPSQIPKSHPCPSSFSLKLQFGRKQRPASVRWVSATDGPVAAGEATSGLYSAKVYDLTAENVNRVLDDVRPYLISDGGNVDVVSVEDGVISLQLQGLNSLASLNLLCYQ